MTEQTLYRRNFLLHLQERPEYSEPALLKEPAHEQLSGAQIGQLHNEYAISRQLENVAEGAAPGEPGSVAIIDAEKRRGLDQAVLSIVCLDSAVSPSRYEHT